MEKIFIRQQQQQQSISLKNLPPIPIDPPGPPPIFPFSSQVKKGKPNPRYEYRVVKEGIKEEKKAVKFDEVANSEADLLADTDATASHKGKFHGDGDGDDASVCSIKHIDPNNINKIQNKVNEAGDDKASHNNSGPIKVSAKSQLHEVCNANSWKPPLFECFREEGPPHMRMFTFKVIMEIEEAPITVLECFGGPRSKKKEAAEHAAEGALWYLKNLGYFPITKRKKNVN